MSYDIYRSVKFNDDGTIDTVVASSNLFNSNGGRCFEKYKMDFYTKYTTLNKEQKMALFLVHSWWSGSRFYAKNWKEKSEIVSVYMKTHKYDDFRDDVPNLLENLNELIMFMDEYKKESKRYIAKLNGYCFLENIFKRRYRITTDRDRAKVYIGRADEILDKLQSTIPQKVELLEI